MEKKNIDHGPIAWGFGLGIGFLIGHYLPEDAPLWQDVLIWVAVIILGPLIWLPNSKN